MRAHEIFSKQHSSTAPYGTLLFVRGWDLYSTLNNLAEDNQVTVFWIPGHRGIKGDEIADRLAKLAARQNRTGLEPVIGISNSLVTEDNNEWLVEEHQKDWHKALGYGM